ncbi:DMT family transporter [Phyllobacterium leguminum]|uniref:EamA domain-containing membrane protein RarD n=1 Tax=Phyllobacterium leguminum TaxID=314237 RepID=A0A318T084_9HYPH|nr:DMT family transporter [Phyllobacterium leguminum]PYE87875.1 EamA domain-containing membrane protein RarD [Phyllobacterium leguminum]
MLQGIILAFAAYAAFAFSDACVKALDGTLSPYEVVFFGAVFGLVALPFMKRGDEKWRDIFITQNKPMWLLRTLMAAACVLGSVVAFTHLSMAEAFALIFLLPAFVTILSVVFLKEQVGWRRWSAVGIGFIGVLIVLRPGFRELSIGHLAAFIAGFTAAVGIVIMRVMGNREKRITLYSSGLIGPIVISGLLMATDYAHPTAQQWLYLAGYGLLAALASILLMLAAQRAPASAIASPQYSQMIWAILFGYFIFHDTIDLPMLIGIVLIIASGFFTFIREKKRGVAQPPPVATSEPGPILLPDEAKPEKM